MSTLEGNKAMPDPNLRVLYVPKECSWDETIAYGVKLIKSGYSVRVHGHSSKVVCTPNGATERCGQLTPTENGAILVPDSNTDAPLDN